MPLGFNNDDDLEAQLMKCPTDSATLVMSERGGVEIDYCPECRGVWLDRGELDKIIDRAEKEFAAVAAPVAPAQAPTAPQQQYPTQQQSSGQYGERSDRGYNDRDRNRNSDSRDGHRPKKRENWLGELFG